MFVACVRTVCERKYTPHDMRPQLAVVNYVPVLNFDAGPGIVYVVSFPCTKKAEHRERSSIPIDGACGERSAFLLASLARCLEDEHAFIVHLDLFPVRELHVQWLIIEIVDEIGSLSVFDKHVGEEMVGRDRSIVVTETV